MSKINNNSEVPLQKYQRMASLDGGDYLTNQLISMKESEIERLQQEIAEDKKSWINRVKELVTFVAIVPKNNPAEIFAVAFSFTDSVRLLVDGLFDVLDFDLVPMQISEIRQRAESINNFH